MFQPNFKYTNKIVRLLVRIQAAREVIIYSPLIPAWEKQLQREALMKQTHHTTSIEGNPLTLEEVELIIEGKEVLAHEKDKKEVQNYVDVLKYIDSLPENGPITEEFLLEIHRLTAKISFLMILPATTGKCRSLSETRKPGKSPYPSGTC